ncbi:MAG TPA: hypothetical protein VGQ00_03890 [Candidatus Norongarragalinales archaeon]|jgi:hypothetical protein|nr:hypothetical protein [Candidatus Norongarragalinales archaeon]
MTQRGNHRAFRIEKQIHQLSHELLGAHIKDFAQILRDNQYWLSDYHEPLLKIHDQLHRATERKYYGSVARIVQANAAGKGVFKFPAAIIRADREEHKKRIRLVHDQLEKIEKLATTLQNVSKRPLK